MMGARSSAVQRVYATLRGMAMSYKWPPGERLNEVELARQLQVSRTPLREAMNRLASEGLIVAEAKGGFRARTLDVKEVFDLYELRLALETSITNLACDRADKQALNELSDYLAGSAQAQEAASVDRLVELDEGFHNRVAGLTGNLEMGRMLASINARIHFFRWVDMQGRRDTTQKEHRAILSAIARRDSLAAQDLMEKHISRRLDQIVEVIRAGYGSIYLGEGPDASPPVSDIKELS